MLVVMVSDGVGYSDDSGYTDDSAHSDGGGNSDDDYHSDGGGYSDDGGGFSKALSQSLSACREYCYVSFDFRKPSKAP